MIIVLGTVAMIPAYAKGHYGMALVVYAVVVLGGLGLMLTRRN